MACSPSVLLSPDEPLPYLVTEGDNLSFLVICDHAGARIPESLGELGMQENDRLDHIGWDIGAAWVARRIAKLFNAPLVEGVYSRLVIDCNRYPDAGPAMPASSDRRTIPGNQALTDEQRAARIDEIFLPYHAMIAARIDKARNAGISPVLISIHSCTASMGGIHRPWEIGVGWLRDQRISKPLIEHLKARGDVVVGDNEPYGIDLGIDFSTPEHAMAQGLAHMQIEFRQDLLSNQTRAEHWADIFAEAVLAIRDDDNWHNEEKHLNAQDGVYGYENWLSRHQNIPLKA
ncbi:MAG: N-formylglutamate amidohydrolase [Sphingobium sp.]|nr:N-formylglutamate amidohydrolase [Sphingobium sp.]